MENSWDSLSEDLKKTFLVKLASVPHLFSFLMEVGSDDVMLLMDQARKIKKRKNPKFPPINADFYDIQGLLSDEDRKLVAQVRQFMLTEVAPIANEYWLKAEFPFHIIKGLKKLNIAGLTFDKSVGGQGRLNLLEGIIGEEIARTDTSICTFWGVHCGLAMTSIDMCGSEEQRQKFLPPMMAMDKIGAFGLTEPEVGSAASMGLKTTCKRNGDTWTINGQKKWIGNATFADYIVLWAKDEADNHVKGFILDRETPGLTTEKIMDKMSLRTVQNAVITLKNVEVPEERRLQKANSFKDTALVLRKTRVGVAWQAVGCAKGAYENTLAYTMKREQFGRPIGGFQITQDMLAQMLSQLTAMQSMVARLSQLQDLGKLSDEQASLAKIFCTVSCRQITSMSRELMGGNGILLSHNVARFLADAEALYSYEGTKQINSLVVGRAITGMSAFT